MTTPPRSVIQARVHCKRLVVLVKRVVDGGGSNHRSITHITQITIDHAWKAASLEVTVVVLAYHESNLQHSLVC